jgi:CBS domain-containing membrane protein
MDNNNVCLPPSNEDLREALKEMKAYVDVTEEDLKKIYAIALQHARKRLASRVPVKDVMTKDVIAVKTDTDLQEAARLLSEHRISGMPVIDSNSRVIGVISEADLLVLAGLKKEHTFKDVLRNILGPSLPAQANRGNRVENAMSVPPITASADDDIGEVAKILDQRRIKRLPVVDGEGRLMGVVSRADIVRAMGRSRER